MAPVREVLSYSSLPQLVAAASSKGSTLAGKRPRTDASGGMVSTAVSLDGSSGSSLRSSSKTQEITLSNVAVRPVVLQDFGKRGLQVDFITIPFKTVLFDGTVSAHARLLQGPEDLLAPAV
jgi:hypothetical protein